MIATPGHSFTQGYMKSLLKTINALSAEGISWTFLNEYSSLVAHAREMTLGGSRFNDPNVSEPLHGRMTYDKIIWIDSDITWEPIDFFKLYNSDKEVVSGCYLLHEDSCAAFLEPLGASLTRKDILLRDKPFKVYGVGFGFLCVSSGVFERIQRPWFSQEEIEIVNKDTGVVEKKFPLMGEDLAWCNKVQKMGVEIWLDPKVRVGHQKTVTLDWTDGNGWSIW